MFEWIHWWIDLGGDFKDHHALINGRRFNYGPITSGVHASKVPTESFPLIFIARFSSLVYPIYQGKKIKGEKINELSSW